MVHRAFSVFLFSPEGKLLLQQRAATKVTFAGIWANTCCSHPLATESESAMEGARGVLTAARRKLQQELGIAPEQVPLDSFTWLTRVHYVGASASGGGEGGSASASGSSSSTGGGAAAAAAAARGSGGSGSSGSSGGSGGGGEPLWGEHEIDWILLCTPRSAPAVAPNPNEVQAVREFTQGELREWLRAGSGVPGVELVTPWFGVMERSGLLYRWWDAVLAAGAGGGGGQRGRAARAGSLPRCHGRAGRHGAPGVTSVSAAPARGGGVQYRGGE